MLLSEETFTIPDSPSPYELQKLLTRCSNAIATLSDEIARAKQVQTRKTHDYKIACAKSRIANQNKGTVKIVEALVELDESVLIAAQEMQEAAAYTELLQAKLDGYDAHFKALRKVAEVRKTEMNTIQR